MILYGIYKGFEMAIKKHEPKKNATPLVLGILALIFWWVPVVGLVLPIVGLATRKLDDTGVGTAGLVTSIIALVFAVLVHFVWFFTIIYALMMSEATALVW